MGSPSVMLDPHQDEPRIRSVGKTNVGRYVFLVFIMRTIEK